MSHSIAELRQKNPMWYFERNYVALLEMLEILDLGVRQRVEFVLEQDEITVVLAEQTRYTLLVNIEHRFHHLHRHVPALRFEIRIYKDAKLAEVTGYQGVRHLRARYCYPNKSMYHPDEKRQTNLILYDWLCACSRLNFGNVISGQ